MYTYDYLLTLDQEVRVMWNRKPGPLGICILISRYSTAVTSILSFPVGLVPAVSEADAGNMLDVT